MEKPRLKDFFLVSDIRGGGVYTVGRILRLERFDEILGAKGDLGQEAFKFLHAGDRKRSS